MNRILCSLVIILFGLSVQAQDRMVSGYISDATTGETLIGATIIVTETGNGSTTEYDGSYALAIKPAAKTLTISYTGYKTKVIDIGDASSIDILLTPGELLNEVLVIGYGAIEKSDKTGAIESIKLEDDDVMQYDNFEDYLQGRATGVQILSSGNELLSPSSIRIRGANSLRGDNEPLFVVDGIIVNSSTEGVADPLRGGSSSLSVQSGLTGINPQDIESIEILKDASATAIYGSRGANGVVLITTKKGASGETKFQYRSTVRVGQATNLLNVLDADEYVDYINDFRSIRGFDPTFYRYGDGSIARFANDADFMEANADSIPRFEKVDWQSNIYQPSIAHGHRLSASGGSETSSFYIAGGFNDAQGTVPGTRLRSGDFLLKYSHQLSDRLSVSPRLSTSYTVNNASKGNESLGSSNASLSRQIIEAAPLIGYVDQQIAFNEEQAVAGPRVWIEDYNDDGTEFRTLASLTTEYRISDVFTYQLLAGVDYRNKERKLWFGTGINRGRLANGEAGIGELSRIRYNVDNTLQFKKSWGKRHKVNGTVGVILDDINIEQTSITSQNFANQSLRYDGISFGQNFFPPEFFASRETILSYIGRANYTLDNKYLFTASFRRDGSSKFQEENRWSFFPSAAFAWKLIKEPVFAESTLWSDAKLRIGYGRTGSQAINPYQTLTRFTPTANLQSDANGGGVIAVNPNNLANADLRWETTDQLNIGFDFGFKNDRFTGNLDVYQKVTNDLLQVLNIGPSVGFSTIVTNQGSLTNRGIELGLSGFVLDGPVKWELFGNISVNRNEITDLGVPEAVFGTESRRAILGSNVSGGTVFKVPANIFIEGQQAGLFWGMETDGIINTPDALETAPDVYGVAPQLGDINYIDQNGDGLVNESDLTIIGDPNPDYTFGLGSNLSYKAWSLNMFVNGVQGFDIANGNLGRQGIPTGLSQNIRSEAYFEAWSEDNTDAAYPRLGYPIQGDFTDRMVEDGSFIRLTFVSLGYTFPSNTIKGVENLNVFLTGHNLLLLTNYSGYDPEVNSFSFDPTRVGIDWNSFPNQRSFSFGLNVGF